MFANFKIYHKYIMKISYRNRKICKKKHIYKLILGKTQHILATNYKLRTGLDGRATSKLAQWHLQGTLLRELAVKSRKLSQSVKWSGHGTGVPKQRHRKLRQEGGWRSPCSTVNHVLQSL